MLDPPPVIFTDHLVEAAELPPCHSLPARTHRNGVEAGGGRPQLLTEHAGADGDPQAPACAGAAAHEMQARPHTQAAERLQDTAQPLDECDPFEDGAVLYRRGPRLTRFAGERGSRSRAHPVVRTGTVLSVPMRG